MNAWTFCVPTKFSDDESGFTQLIGDCSWHYCECCEPEDVVTPGSGDVK